MLTSQHLQYEGSVQIKVFTKQDKDGRSSQSSLSSSETPLLGELEVRGKRIETNLPAQSGDVVFFGICPEMSSKGL